MVYFQQRSQSHILASKSQKMTEVGCFDQINQKYTTKIHLDSVVDFQQHSESYNFALNSPKTCLLTNIFLLFKTLIAELHVIQCVATYGE